MTRFFPTALLASCLAMGASFTGAPTAAAQSGVVEINQACAKQTGCFPSDDAGYPVTITKSGSYRLTSNLATQSAGTHNFNMIEITADDVDVDLGGFRISCSSFLVNTECSGDGRGIYSTARGTTVTNGSVIGMGRDGLLLGAESRVINVSAVENGGRGIWTGTGSIVANCLVQRNAGEGILATSSATVRDSVARQNQSSGIQSGSNSLIRNNNSTHNLGSGIVAGGGSTVIGNTASRNDLDGFQLSGNSFDPTTAGGLAQSNVAMLNEGFGFDSSFSLGGFAFQSSGWGLIENVARGNNGDGDQIRGGTELGQNLCGGNTICP